jgi:diguanylate cyclase (GGDEF)-like protein/PAS domain S-box-containing protein
MKRSFEEEKIFALERQLVELRTRVAALEEERQTLFERLPDALFLVKDVFVACNAQAGLLLGVLPTQIVGRTPAHFSPLRQSDGEISSERWQRMLKAAQSGEVLRFAWQCLRADGQMLDCEVTLSAWLSAGEPLLLAVVRNVSARRRAQRLLEEHRRQLNLLVNALPIQAASLGVDLIYRSVNPLYAQFWGSSPAQIQGLPMRRVLGQTAWAQCEPYIEKVLQGQSQTFEQLVRRDDQLFVLCHRCVPQYAENGAVIGFFIFVEDVTRRKQTEIALHRKEAIFHTLVETTAAALLIYRGCEALFINPRVEQLTGYTFAELRSDFTIMLHPEERQRALEYAEARLRGQQVPARYEIRLLTRSGETRWVDVSAGLTTFEGQLAGLVTAYDITERKKAEQFLRESEERYRTLVEALPEAITLTDLDGRVKFVSQGGLMLFGLQDVQDAQGRNLLEWLTEADRPRAVQDLRKMLTEGERKMGVYAAQRDDGTVFYLEVKGEVLHDEREMPHELLFISRDITERREAEQRLEYVSTHDALTGIYNRTFFEAELGRLRRLDAAFPLSVVMIDLDELKRINDRYGHSAGDELLRRTARLLMRLLRQQDVLARIGGDEFAILLPCTNREMADELSNRLRHGIELHNQQYPEQAIKLSFGVATAEGPQLLTAVLAAADERMYAEKMERRAKKGR